MNPSERCRIVKKQIIKRTWTTTSFAVMEMCLLNANLTVKVVVDIRLVKFPSFARDWIRESSKNLKKKNKPAEKLPN